MAKITFHPAGIILILIGAAGAFLSLFWDVIYRSRALRISAIGPFQLVGLIAGLAIAAAGVTAGMILGRRVAARAGAVPVPSWAATYKLLGLLTVIGGLGGTFLSLLWDVLRRGRAFSTASIGPMKMMGIAAGIILMAVGIVMVLSLARRKPVVPAQEKVPVQEAAAPVQQTAMPKPQEEIPFALAVEQAHPAQAGAVPMEAIPIED